MSSFNYKTLMKMLLYRYVLDSGTAAPLTLSMLEVLHQLNVGFFMMRNIDRFLPYPFIFQEMLSSPRIACRVRAFDLILNLGVHAHLLEPMMTDDASTIEEEYPQESFFDDEDQLTTEGKKKVDSAKKLGASTAIDEFESWILNILYEILLLLVQV